MKACIYIFTFCIILLTPHCEYAAQTVFQTSNQFRGATYRSAVSENDLTSVPKWDAHQDFPPLAPRRAELAAKRAIQKLMPEITDWTANRISIRRAGTPDNWIYVVELSTLFPQGEIRGKLEAVEVLVLLNGIAVIPTKD